MTRRKLLLSLAALAATPSFSWAQPKPAEAKRIGIAAQPNQVRGDEITPQTQAAIDKGTGVATQEYLPKARIVRAFNGLNNKVFTSEAHRAGEKLGVPIGGDDPEAVAVVARLVTDAGFEPVVVGSLAQTKSFDSSSQLFLKSMTARELRQALGLPAAR